MPTSYIYLKLTADSVHILQRLVIDAADETEVCGVLVGVCNGPRVWSVTNVHPLSNMSLRKDSFAIDVQEFCRKRDLLEREGFTILALYHSHTDGSTRPSIRDLELPRLTSLPSVILAHGDQGLAMECYGEPALETIPVLVTPLRCGTRLSGVK